MEYDDYVKLSLYEVGRDGSARLVDAPGWVSPTAEVTVYPPDDGSVLGYRAECVVGGSPMVNVRHVVMRELA